ncbi:MAG: RNA repair domain-containing protein [Candidatus Thermoplasmatota archaeon]
MHDIRDVLNKIKWTQDIYQVKIWYLHRGAPGNIRSIQGTDIKAIGKSFLETSSAMIPYHRILRIEYNSVILFDRIKKK